MDKTKYSMTCPVPDCDHEIEVEAGSEDEAVQEIMKAGKAHFDEVHPDADAMDPAEMESKTRSAMKKHE